MSGPSLPTYSESSLKIPDLEHPACSGKRVVHSQNSLTSDLPQAEVETFKF